MVELSKKLVAPLLPKHPENAHKYTVGTLLCITGSDRMTGAAILCAKGALLSGAGLVYQSSSEYALGILQSALYEPVFLTNEPKAVREYARKAKAVVFGCGLENNSHNTRLLEYILNECDVPTVVDAGGIQMLAELGGAKALGENVVLTPHEGEMARLTGEPVTDRERAVRELCKSTKATLVLKGSGTLIGKGDELFVNTTGSMAMAKGGYGDLLSGMLGSLLCQGADTLSAAKAAVYLHGLAGDITAEKYTSFGAIPTLCAENIPEAFKRTYKQ